LRPGPGYKRPGSKGPAAYTKDKPDLSPKRVPTKKQDRNCQTVIKIWSQASDGCFMPRKTGRLTVGRKMRLRLRLRQLIEERQLNRVSRIETVERNSSITENS
jgi:hypothetical protein